MLLQKSGSKGRNAEEVENYWWILGLAKNFSDRFLMLLWKRPNVEFKIAFRGLAANLIREYSWSKKRLTAKCSEKKNKLLSKLPNFCSSSKFQTSGLKKKIASFWQQYLILWKRTFDQLNNPRRRWKTTRTKPNKRPEPLKALIWRKKGQYHPPEWLESRLRISSSLLRVLLAR